jgi:hypothetical protein
MEGILYLSDAEQKKRFVQIDLDIFGDEWENIVEFLNARSKKLEEKEDAALIKAMKEADRTQKVDFDKFMAKLAS